jgi:hypothetical protein
MFWKMGFSAPSNIDNILKQGVRFLLLLLFFKAHLSAASLLFSQSLPLLSHLSAASLLFSHVSSVAPSRYCAHILKQGVRCFFLTSSSFLLPILSLNLSLSCHISLPRPFSSLKVSSVAPLRHCAHILWPTLHMSFDTWRECRLHLWQRD